MTRSGCLTDLPNHKKSPPKNVRSCVPAPRLHRLTTRGYRASQPIETSKTMEGQGRNRRVECNGNELLPAAVTVDSPGTQYEHTFPSENERILEAKK